MTIDLVKVQRYGQRMGADVAIVIDGQLHNYFKKGDRASRFCLYSLTNHNNKRPIRWESTTESTWERVVGFWRNLGKSVDVIVIEELKKDEESGHDSKE